MSSGGALRRPRPRSTPSWQPCAAGWTTGSALAQRYADVQVRVRRHAASPPPSVRVYPSAQAFVDEDSPSLRRLARARTVRPRRRRLRPPLDVGGPRAAVPDQPAAVSWIGETGEVYALQVYRQIDGPSWEPWEAGPVWLLASGLPTKHLSLFSSDELIWKRLSTLELTYRSHPIAWPSAMRPETARRRGRPASPARRQEAPA